MTFPAVNFRILAALVWSMVFISQVAAAPVTTMTLQDARDIFAAGNAFYKSQQYAEAQQAYNELFDGGYDTAPVLYNLGTTDARLGSSTLALAYLQRAKKLSPRDSDIRANLEFITAAAHKSRSPQADEASAESLWKRVYGWLTAEEWLLLTWAGLMGIALGISAMLVLKRPRWRYAGKVIAAVSLIITVCLAVPTLSQVYATRIQKKAMVVAPADMLSGPADRFTRVTSLDQGQVLRLLGHSSGGYARAETVDGMTGYVLQDALVRL